MKLFKQLPTVISEKALKISTYSKLAIALLAIFLWIVPTASTFAATKTMSQEIVNFATVQFPVENITLRQLDLGESTNLLADASGQEKSVTNIFDEFAKAWKNQPNNRDESLKAKLFGVCESFNSDLDQKSCFASLMLDLENRKENLINGCYKGPNGRVCLNIILGELGIKLQDIDSWSEEIRLAF